MAEQHPFVYSIEPELTVDDFVDILNRSTLAERRPVDNRQQLEAMLKNAQLIVTARKSPTAENNAGLLVGISRAITDFSYCTYLSDLAVDQSYQGQGIGKRLIHQTHQAAGLQTRLILLAAPKAQSYYPHIGMQPHQSCWQLDPVIDDDDGKA